MKTSQERHEIYLREVIDNYISMHGMHDIYSNEIEEVLEGYLEYCYFFNRINEIIKNDKFHVY